MTEMAGVVGRKLDRERVGGGRAKRTGENDERRERDEVDEFCSHRERAGGKKSVKTGQGWGRY